ncbi:hypothetical protein F2Q69_00013328 [Brassica cretica]|uniref:Uncharacterized protein n=1 Tax=Brassica cretica TaxID=69181 RepID=A0A8S9R2I4_BRACR|nr:hypothetical protein F2Q69_00013328 [Brassica cretica]
MQVDEATEGRRLRKRKEKIPKNLKREANEKEMDGFTKRVLRIPVEKPFDEVYYTHRLWMFFRGTKETEEDIRRMFHHVRERMKLRITLKKKSDPGKFAIPCVYIPSSTRNNKDKRLLFSEDPAHLERTIRKDQRSTSLDAAAFTPTDSHIQPSTDTRPSSSTDLHRSTLIDTTPLTSIDPLSRSMVAIDGDLYDQDGHLCNATDDDFWQVVKHEKLGEGDFEVESSMSFDGSQWCRPMSMDAHRQTDHDEDRSIEYSNNRSTSSDESIAECSAVRIMTNAEFAEKHPHPSSPFYVKIDRPHERAIDRQRETNLDRPPSPPIDRRAPLTYRV